MYIHRIALIQFKKKNIKKIFYKSREMKKMRITIAILVAQLIHSKSVQEAKPIIRNIVKFFGYRNEIPFDMSLKYIRYSRNKEFNFSQSNDKPDDIIDQSKRYNSLYFKILKSIKADVLRENNVKNNAPQNKWYSLKFIKYVFVYLLPYFCLQWSLNV